MPTTVNGIGTHYYGKKNLSKENGQCEFCGNAAELLTYETGLYFVVIFIPLIPLGRKQILDECQYCHRHRVMPVAEWERVREEAIGTSTGKLAESMNDPMSAIEHLQTLTAFKQFEEARDLAPAIEAQHQDNVDVQFFMGAWYEQYGDPAVADVCFERAYKLDPKHAGAVRAKGIGLIQAGNLDEANQVLSALHKPSESYDPSIFFMLGCAFQDATRHDQAMEMFEMIARDTPELIKEKEFKKVVKKTEKALGRTESILPKGWFG